MKALIGAQFPALWQWASAAVGLIGGICGIVAYAARLRDEHRGYLRISVQASQLDEHTVTVLTTVTNNSTRPKELDYALLLIGPESIGTGVATIWGPTIDCTNAIIRLRSQSGNDLPLYRRQDGAALIPLPFYYSENIGIADETLSYRATIDTIGWPNGAYSVRFFLFPKSRRPFALRPPQLDLHRTSQDLFVLQRKDHCH